MCCSSAVGGRVTRPQIVVAPRSWQAYFWPFPIPNDGGIQVAIGIHGRRAQESVVNETRLRGQHDIVYRGGRHRALKSLQEKPRLFRWWPASSESINWKCYLTRLKDRLYQ
jgi:hypothetical protein